MTDTTAIKDAIFHLKQALKSRGEHRLSELENAQNAIDDAIKGEMK